MSTFKREDRYAVIKYSQLTDAQIGHLKDCIHGEGIPTVECVVIESDWPEYEPVWQMIEGRATSAPVEGGKSEYDAMAKDLLAAPVVERQSDMLDVSAERNAMQRQRDAALTELKRECDSVDEALRLFGVDPDDVRTDGGSLNLAKLKRHIAEQPAPVAVEAAKAFAKGFSTLETAGGKYKIVMQFAGHDDAWAAYTELEKLTARLDGVKELNQ